MKKAIITNSVKFEIEQGLLVSLFSLENEPYKKITIAKYKGSATEPSQFFSDLPEFAFVGRSNVGKSSLINSIVNMKKLARTSSTPGRTKMVNYFLINDSFYFVDLPGYGYASGASKSHKNLWSSLIEKYLLESKQLKLVFLLVDIRHKPSELDLLMQKFLYINNIPTKIIATKSDKIAKSKIANYTLNIAKSLSVGIEDIILFSIFNDKGKEEIFKIIDNLLS
ncbi:MAG: ribosome biogenesis GTP-binding protein YihA/YsxC [Clostridia bacterium]|nr:ribosome biogenesis GTP-binding protein YihA/YsxC [Clostridia bacterium]